MNDNQPKLGTDLITPLDYETAMRRFAEDDYQGNEFDGGDRVTVWVWVFAGLLVAAALLA